MTSETPKCEYCDNTGYIGSRLDIGHYPCTDCGIFWARVQIGRVGSSVNSNATLKPCPFCGGEAKIAISDAEGNAHDADYENDPWSGLSFRITHAHESNDGCPIAEYDCDGAALGVYLYDSREEAAAAWNRRQ